MFGPSIMLKGDQENPNPYITYILLHITHRPPLLTLPNSGRNPSFSLCFSFHFPRIIFLFLCDYLNFTYLFSLPLQVDLPISSPFLFLFKLILPIFDYLHFVEKVCYISPIRDLRNAFAPLILYPKRSVRVPLFYPNLPETPLTLSIYVSLIGCDECP